MSRAAEEAIRLAGIADEAVEAAARYVAAGREPGQPVIADLKTRFGLTTAQACEALRRANAMRGYATRAAS